MLKNYLKIAFRNLIRHKEYTFINITGLTIGLASCILIGLWVSFELSYDSYHENSNRIYRVINDGSAATPPPLAAALKNDYPDLIEESVRMWPIQAPADIEYNDEIFIEDQILFTEANFFEIFTHPFLEGDPETALSAPYTMALSESTARRFFKDESPVGKTVNMWGTDLEITGVFEDVPQNSHYTFNVLVSTGLPQKYMGGMFENWNWNGFYTYVLLPEQVQPESVEAVFEEFALKNTGEKGYGFQLQPLTDIYFNPKDKDNAVTVGNSRYVYILSAIAVFVLLIACINFTILATAKSTLRATEVGLRKTLGAVRSQLGFQFITEAIGLSIIALFMALLLVELILPFFINFTGKPLDQQFQFNLITILLLTGFTILTGILAGSYPTFFLTGLNPVHAFKGAGNLSDSGGSWLRKALISTQFGISCFLIIAMLTVFSQIRFLLNKDLGFNEEQIVITEAKHFPLFKSQLEQLPGVVTVSGAYNVPGERFPFYPFSHQFLPADSLTSMRTLRINPGFLETIGIDLKSGRSFDENRPDDINHGFILNSAAVSYLGFEHPLGKEMEWYNFTEDGSGFEVFRHGPVIGVVDDFNYASLHNPIEPLVIFVDNEVNSTVIRIRPEEASSTLSEIKKVWQHTSGGSPFWYYFLDQQLDSKYASEQKLGDVFAGLTFLALVIACFGLFGLISFTVGQRTKEIGIRKVLGASVSDIVSLLSREFIILVSAGFVLAIPFAWYGMNLWLANFAFHIQMDVWIYIAAGASALFIALVTVSFQSIKAALANPVQSLRNE